ncbi:hypothetical protein M5V91_00080 [Cytobacillus pseudoceanisediminis]|uniref:hypothetical protein n=1 Tax=Cytobacillus pseudoceanisediminis TaxID=3051614 RepID=UPI002189CBE8|nr:hypothetical protein [Cytobacillus pseudoceanisediminis]UQX54367.1 hypothetical protein M5V91_00080 [Cytobacillus pseudoceanisediminis]
MPAHQGENNRTKVHRSFLSIPASGGSVLYRLEIGVLPGANFLCLVKLALVL